MPSRSRGSVATPSGAPQTQRAGMPTTPRAGGPAARDTIAMIVARWAARTAVSRVHGRRHFGPPSTGATISVGRGIRQSRGQHGGQQGPHPVDPRGLDARADRLAFLGGRGGHRRRSRGSCIRPGTRSRAVRGPAPRCRLGSSQRARSPFEVGDRPLLRRDSASQLRELVRCSTRVRSDGASITTDQHHDATARRMRNPDKRMLRSQLAAGPSGLRQPTGTRVVRGRLVMDRAYVALPSTVVPKPGGCSEA